MRSGLLLLAICMLIAWVSAEAPPSFCKCTCFTNSTIIKLSHEYSPPTKEPPPSPSLFSRAGAGSSSATCSQCNRAFCLSQNLPICKGAEEKDIFTMCFQRDSRKDQIIVLLFITATLGLLGWAAVQKFMESRAKVGGPAPPVGHYAPVSGR